MLRIHDAAHIGCLSFQDRLASLDYYLLLYGANLQSEINGEMVLYVHFDVVSQSTSKSVGARFHGIRAGDQCQNLIFARAIDRGGHNDAGRFVCNRDDCLRNDGPGGVLNATSNGAAIDLSVRRRSRNREQSYKQRRPAKQFPSSRPSIHRCLHISDSTSCHRTLDVLQFKIIQASVALPPMEGVSDARFASPGGRAPTHRRTK